jgi:hypothetical protein
MSPCNLSTTPSHIGNYRAKACQEQQKSVAGPLRACAPSALKQDDLLIRNADREMTMHDLPFPALLVHHKCEADTHGRAVGKTEDWFISGPPHRSLFIALGIVAGSESNTFRLDPEAHLISVGNPFPWGRADHETGVG